MAAVISSIQEDIQLGILSFSMIARKHEVPVSLVMEAWDLLCEQESETAYTQALDQDHFYHDHLERDWDEPYEPEEAEPDHWYDNSEDE